MAEIPLFKVIIAGDGGVGKTSLVRQYCEGKFETSRVMTIGVDFQTHVVDLPEGKVKLSIWDMAGQERFAVVRTSFYRGAKACALVYDLTIKDSLEHVSVWYKEIHNELPDVPFILVGNKLDLAGDPDTTIAKKFAEIIHAPLVFTSAASGQGVSDLFEQLARLPLKS